MEFVAVPQINHTSENRMGYPIKPWVRQRRILFLSGVFLFCVILLIIVIARNRAGINAYEERIAALRAKGMPVSLEEVPAWQAGMLADEPPETPMPTDDAGVQAVNVYQEAFALMMQNLQSHNDFDLSGILAKLNSEGVLSQEETRLLRTLLDENREVVELLLKAYRLPAGKYSLDYSKGAQMELEHLGATWFATRLLRVKTYIASMDGDGKGAYEALVAGIALMRPLQKEPILISQLVHGGCMGTLLEAMQDTLRHVALTKEHFAELQHMFNQGHHPETMARALALERASGLSLYEDPVRYLEAMGPRPNDLLHRSYETLIRTYNAFGGYTRDREQFLDYIDAIEYALTLPFSEASNIMPQLGENPGYQSFFPSIAETLNTNLEIMPMYQALNTTRHIQGATVAAIEQYRLDHGTRPPELNALTPNYLPETPQDPFDLQPMRYRREGNGYMLYSVGPDGDDNGGTLGEDYGEGDLVFHVGR